MRRLNLQLSKKEIFVLQKEWRKTKDKRFAIRCHAILLTQKGYQLQEIANILDCGIATVKNWVRNYRNNSIAGLRTKPQVGNHRKLTTEEITELSLRIKRSPAANGIGKWQFWTVRLLKRLVMKLFGVRYRSNWSYQLLFYKCGFSFQRPTTGFKEQNKTAVRKFKERLKKNFGHWVPIGLS